MRSNKLLRTVVSLAELGTLPDMSSDSDSDEMPDMSSDSSWEAILEALASSSDSSSSSEAEAMERWREATTHLQLGLVLAAAEPYCRDGITYAIGPDRYSLRRVEELWACSTKCKAMFRFELCDIRELLVALQLPD